MVLLSVLEVETTRPAVMGQVLPAARLLTTEPRRFTIMVASCTVRTLW